MQFGKIFGTLFALFVTFTPAIVSASSGEGEIPLAGGYDFTKDPYLFTWTFTIEEKEPVKDKTLSTEDKLLAKWKVKQSTLWENLETGKKFVMNASAYTAAADECGKNDGVTASGLKVAEGRTLACPASFPFGAKIKIARMGTFQCEDRGGAIKGNHFDIYMKTKKDAFAFGRQHLEAEIVEN